MPHEDLTHYQARQLLMGEAAAAELYARRCEVAMAEGDAAGGRRWNRRYALSAFRCRTLGALLRMWATCCPSPALRPGRTRRCTIRQQEEPTHDTRRISQRPRLS